MKKVRTKAWVTELKELLLARNYPESLIDRSIEKAKKIPREVALMKVKKKTTENRSIFIATRAISSKTLEGYEKPG